MRADHAAQMAVEIMRRDVHLVHVRHGGDLQRLPEPVPHHVDDRHVHRVRLEIGLEVAAMGKRLAGRDRAHGAGADVGERIGIVGIDLEPGEVVRRDRIGDALEALGLEMEVDVQHQPHLGSDRVAERRHRALGGLGDAVVPVELGPARGAPEARAERDQATARIGGQDVGLERAEAARFHLLGVAGELVVAGDGGHAHLCRVANAVGAAMRPVQRDAVAHRAAEQRIDRDTERLPLDVEQRVLDRRDRLLVEAAARLPRRDMQARDDPLVGQRILADERGRQRGDDGGKSGAAEALIVFGPAGQTIIGGDLEEGEQPPTGVGLQGLDPGDPHLRLLRRAASMRRAGKHGGNSRTRRRRDWTSALIPCRMVRAKVHGSYEIGAARGAAWGQDRLGHGCGQRYR